MLYRSAVVRKMMSVILAMALGLFLFGVANAEENKNAQKDLAGSIQSWSEQTRRAPHYGFTGTEYNKDEWPIIMLRMATIGQMPYSEAMQIANYLSLLAPESKAYPEPLGWLNSHFVVNGIGYFSSDLKNKEHETGMLFSPNIYARFGERWLLQLEPEFNLSLHPGKKDFDLEGIEYVHLTYFAGDHLQLTAGKIINDFNFSRARLHSNWANVSQDLPWASSFVPESTLGGKVGWNYQIAEGVRLNGSFWGGTGRTEPRFEADPMFGTRMGAYFPERNLEAGVSYATTRGENIVGGYFIKTMEPVKLQGEVVKSMDKGTAYWLEASVNFKALPIRNETAKAILSRVTPVLRWQQFWAKGRGHHEESEEVSDMGMESSGGHDESLPEKNAQELYAGLNYELFRYGPYTVKFQIGHGFGFGETGNTTKAGIVFRW